MARSTNHLRLPVRHRATLYREAEILEQRCMLSAGDLDTSFNGVGFNITSSISNRDQLSTTMGIFPRPFPNYTVMGGYREVPKTSDRIKDPADLELIFLDQNGHLLPFGPEKNGSVRAQVGLGDSRIAGLDFQILDGTLYIVTTGYTVVSGGDLEYLGDDPDWGAMIRSPSRRFREEDIGATLEIISSNGDWVKSKYQIINVLEDGPGNNGIAYLGAKAPAKTASATGGRWTLNGSTDVVVSRFVYTGSDVILDRTFGRNGHHIIPVARGIYNYDYGYAIRVDHGAGEQIIVAGYSQAAQDDGKFDMMVMRLAARNGGLITSFEWKNQPDGQRARGGRVMIDIKSDDYANAVEIAADGSILLAGSSNGKGSPSPTFVKLSAGGVPVEGFGPDKGIVVLSPTDAGRGFVNSMAFRPGTIVAVGTKVSGGRDTFIARLSTTTGELDPNFGTNGVVIDDLAPGRSDWGNSVILQPGGGGGYAIVVVGSIEVPSEDYNMFVARYLNDGRRDASFYKDSRGNQMHVHILSELHSGTSLTYPDYGATVKLDHAGRIVLTGSVFSRPAGQSSAANFDMTAVRLVSSPVASIEPEVNANDRIVVENDTGTLKVAIELVLTVAATGPITVEYATADGTGVAGKDYIATQGKVTFNAGITTQTLDVSIIGNKDYQPNRTVLLNILSAAGASVGTTTAIVTIRDNDGTWQNLAIPEDVDGDLDVKPQDVLRLIDDYQRYGPRQLVRALATPELWYDVNGDTVFTPSDILAVLDTVNRKSPFGNQQTEYKSSLANVTADLQPIAGGSLAAEIATGLVAPVNAPEIAAVMSLDEPADFVEVLSQPPISPMANAAAMSLAIGELEDSPDSLAWEADAELYELIALGS